MKAFVVFLELAVTLPIWFYVLYQILSAVGASELTWFLFWVYIPASIVAKAFTSYYLEIKLT